MRKNISNDILYDIHTNNIFVNNREIFLCDTVIDGQCAGVTIDTYSSFIKNLKFLEYKSKEPIVIHQFSYGGDWSSGMAIYDAIINSPCNFIYICHGVAASMGSIMPQAVFNKGYRLISDNCSFMIHEGSISIDGTTKGAAASVEANNAATSVMYEIYTNVCSNGEYFKGDKKSQIKSYLKRKLNMKEDWWLSAKDSVYYGFFDGILNKDGYSINELLKGI